MPFTIRHPASIDPDTAVNGMVLNTDFAPTFLDYAGIGIPAGIQGKSMRPLLTGETPEDWRTSMYYRYYYSHFNTPAHWGLRTHDHKLIYYHDSDEWELYDLNKDPMEMSNIYGSADPELIQSLKDELYHLKGDCLDDESPEEGNARARRLLS